MKVIAITIELDDGVQIVLRSREDVECVVDALEATREWIPARLRLEYNWSQRIRELEAREREREQSAC